MRYKAKSTTDYERDFKLDLERVCLTSESTVYDGAHNDFTTT